MSRSTLVGCLAALGALVQFTADARAQPRKEDEIYVILTARLYEVDEAFVTKLAGEKWHSKAALERMEGRAVEPESKSPGLFARLKKLKPLLSGKEAHIGPGKEGVFLSSTKAANFLPAPEQLRKGKKIPQTFQEGFSLKARVHISADRRYVRIKFVEKSLEVEGTEKVDVLLDDKGAMAVGERVFLKEGSQSRTRYIPDGAGFLLPLQYRPRATKNRKRWLVVRVEPLIYIEEEERVRRGEAP